MTISQRSICILILALFAAMSAFAQGSGTTSSLSGTVMSGGKPFPGVTVTISSPSLQGVRTATTGEGGGYTFPSLPPGDYTVKFELEGMATVVKHVTLVLAGHS